MCCFLSASLLSTGAGLEEGFANRNKVVVDPGSVDGVDEGIYKV